MTERPRFFDDLAGMAGGAMSALTGLRDEAEAMARARMDEAIRKLDLVKREQLDAMTDIAAAAREGQIAAESRLAALEARIAALEAKDTPAHTPPAPPHSAPPHADVPHGDGPDDGAPPPIPDPPPVFVS